MSIKKTKIVLDLDADSLKELRKTLFRKGLSPQKFFTHVLDLVALRDERLMSVIDAASKQDRGKSREGDLDAESLYQLIQDGLDETKQENGAENDAQEQSEEST